MQQPIERRPAPPLPTYESARLHAIRLIHTEEPYTLHTVVEEMEEDSDGSIAWDSGDIAIQTTASMKIMDTPRPLHSYRFARIPQTPIDELPPALDISKQTTAHLMRLSGMMPIFRVSDPPPSQTDPQADRPPHRPTTTPRPTARVGPTIHEPARSLRERATAWELGNGGHI